MATLKLTTAEKEAGHLAVFACPKHGDVVVTFKDALVTCQCGKKAAPTPTKIRGVGA